MGEVRSVNICADINLTHLGCGETQAGVRSRCGRRSLPLLRLVTEISYLCPADHLPAAMWMTFSRADCLTFPMPAVEMADSNAVLRFLHCNSNHCPRLLQGSHLYTAKWLSRIRLGGVD